jgi:predicted Zn-dependent peptidase
MKIRMSKLFLLCLVVCVRQLTFAQNKYEWKQASAAGYTYSYVTNDPMKTRFYGLKNGMSVILSVNNKEPRITTKIAVRAGSNTDPKEHTGLAHYLEHLLFKGTDKYGSLDWSKEKPLLDNIEELYEVYNQTSDVGKRKDIYKEIDRVSGEASKYSISNEYTKMMSAMGAQGTNAHTWVEETVYEEDIPSGCVDKFLILQAERFHNPVFRLFHTELEAVYEEKNRSLDNDSWKMQDAMHYYLFPTHNYGQQTTIGAIEHLKNPSLKAIRDYYNHYYVPNNIAIIMAGDFDPDYVVKKIDENFAYMQPKAVREYKPAAELPLKGPIVKDIYGPGAENLYIVYRTGADGTREAMMAELVSTVLSNGKAGLMDLNLSKQQKLLGAGAGVRQYRDYGIFMMMATPKQGQTLEEAKDLLLGQIELLKKGQFDESLLKAIVANTRLSEIQGLESNDARAGALMEVFIKNAGKAWDKNVAMPDEISKVTRQDVVDFARQFFADNYVVLYKRKGEDKNVVKVEKPPITPVETNAGKQSEFVVKLNTIPATPVKPKWLDFNKDIQKARIGNADLLYVQNKDNQLFRLYYRFDMGSWNNKLLPLAASYLSFLGTNKYSAEQISKEFYNIACSFSISAGTDVTTVTLSGLQESFDKAVSLFEHIMANCKPDEEALAGLKSRILKSRANNKLDKGAIMNGLMSYATYGAKNPFNYTLSEAAINSLKGAELVQLLHDLFNHKHSVLYFGPKSMASFALSLKGMHKMPAQFKAIPAAVKFERSQQTTNQVLFANYDMVQSEIRWFRNASGYAPEKEAVVDLFNGYFGSGMGSVVFQTIRESKALAYSTFAFFNKPSKKEDPFSVVAYVSCQADKMNDAVKGMNALLDELPESDKAFETARASLKNDLETERITNDGVLFTYLAARRKGINYDIRKCQYQAINNMTFSDIQKFHHQELANKSYTYCVVASEKKVDEENLKQIGEVKKLSLGEIFGY